MVTPIGSFINAGTIIAGSLIGFAVGNRLTSSMRAIVFNGLGLCVLVIGMQMAMETRNILLVIFSILLGGITGEAIGLENWLNRGGEALKRKLRSKNSQFTEGFIGASMLFCIGSMAILGPLEEGLSGARAIVYTKSLLDGFAAMALTTAFGSGVIFSAFVVLVYQGLITLFAASLQNVLSPDMVLELKATGGILILGISLNMLEVTKIRLSNLIPALPLVILLFFLVSRLNF